MAAAEEVKEEVDTKVKGGDAKGHEITVVVPKKDDTKINLVFPHSLPTLLTYI